MKLSSPDFKNNDYIPERFSCDGENINPVLEISEVKVGTKSLALVVEDPDAPHPNFTHWVMWNLRPSTYVIYRNEVPSGAIVGTNDMNHVAYDGPCPPSGTHRYVFKLFALDSILNLPKGSTKDDLLKAMQGKVTQSAEYVGLYQKEDDEDDEVLARGE